MKNGKVAGINKIIPELLEDFDENMLDLIMLILSFIFEKGTFREEWASSFSTRIEIRMI